MKTGSLFFASVLALAACEDRGARISIEEVRVHRAPEARVVVDVDVLGVERGGGNVGAYCVTAHFLNPVVNPAFLPARTRYVEELEFQDACASDLEDGDTRAFRFVSERTDLPPGAPVRVQARVSRDVDIHDARIP
jgi:hypothetical protein